MMKNYTNIFLKKSISGPILMTCLLISGYSHGQDDRGAVVTNPSACDLDLLIPDAGCANNNSLLVVIPVSGLNDQLGVNAFLNSVDMIISHPWRNDLHVYLTPPGGSEYELMIERGGDGAVNFGDPTNCPDSIITFHDGGGALSSMSVMDNVTGTFAPETPFSSYTGNPNGSWLLRICDAFSDDVGGLEYVALNLSDQIVGIQEDQFFNSMDLWPNPVENELNIGVSANASGIMYIQILDVTGRIVHSSAKTVGNRAETFRIDMNGSAPGLYSVRYALNGVMHTKKIMKQ